uniref:Pyr_redox_2 domain-containing protein n=1 Tax=Ascaris lumbricoides TaxID=6252 RepID=A0A0M3IAB5_ASCLU
MVGGGTLIKSQVLKKLESSQTRATEWRPLRLLREVIPDAGSDGRLLGNVDSALSVGPRDDLWAVGDVEL